MRIISVGQFYRSLRNRILCVQTTAMAHANLFQTNRAMCSNKLIMFSDQTFEFWVALKSGTTMTVSTSHSADYNELPFMLSSK